MKKFIDVFTDLDDFCTYVPNVLVSIEPVKVERACQIAIDNYILKMFDVSIFDRSEEEIKECLRNIIANYAAYEMQKIGNVAMSDQGSFYLEGENMKANFGDKQDALEHFATTADNYLDTLLSICKEKGIKIKAKILSTYFSSLEEFEQFKFLSGSLRTFLALQPQIMQVEKIHILPRINSISTIPADLLFAIRGYVANQVVLSAMSQLRSGANGFIISSFMSSLNQKWNKEEMLDRKKSIEADLNSYSCLLETELNKLFPVEDSIFQNLPENKGFIL